MRITTWLGLAIAAQLGTTPALAAPVDARHSATKPALKAEKSQLKDLGVPEYRDKVLTREQAKAEQADMQRRFLAEQAEAKQRHEALQRLVDTWAREGIQVHGGDSKTPAWRLIAPSLSATPEKARKAKGKTLVTRFKRQLLAVFRGKKLDVQLYLDPAETRRVPL